MNAEFLCPVMVTFAIDGPVTNLDASHGCMALVAFYQLAALYKLSCSDVGGLSESSHPPFMPATKPPNSHSPAVQPGQSNSVPASSPRLAPTTPDRNRGATRPVVHSMPLSVETAIIQKLQPGPDQAQKYDSAKYEQYIVEEFECHGVFVDIDVFMKHVLHIPEDWGVSWARTIRQIKRDPRFLTAQWDLTRQGGTRGGHGEKFYKPLVDMTNTIIKFSEMLPDDSVEPRTRVRYLRNDPKKILHGSAQDLSPDIVAVQDSFLSRLSSREQSEQHLRTTDLTRAQPPHTLEVEPIDYALVDGYRMPRLKVNGKPAQFITTSFSLTRNRKRPTRRPCPSLRVTTIPEGRRDM